MEKAMFTNVDSTFVYPPKEKWKRIALRAIVFSLMAPLLYVVWIQGKSLWVEWAKLRSEQVGVRESVAIGYRGINPNFSYAARPAHWVQDREGVTLIWAGWERNVGHRWFRVGQGEIDFSKMSEPLDNGSDVVRAIDKPICEIGGGDVWRRIPESSEMVPVTLASRTTIYPSLIMSRVLVVNDLFGDDSVVMVKLASVRSQDNYRVYPRVVDGQDAYFAVSGYLFDGNLLLFDRESESLWTASESSLDAIAGVRKGCRLETIAKPQSRAWGDCIEHYPNARLIVGADRTQKPAKK
jgi:hypothetical protein